MSRFPSAGHLISWAGLCPKMDQSAGKRRATRVRAKKAIMAVAASMLTAVYYMLRTSTPYRDLGANHLDRRDKQQITHRLASSSVLLTSGARSRSRTPHRMRDFLSSRGVTVAPLASGTVAVARMIATHVNRTGSATPPKWIRSWPTPMGPGADHELLDRRNGRIRKNVSAKEPVCFFPASLSGVAASRQLPDAVLAHTSTRATGDGEVERAVASTPFAAWHRSLSIRHASPA